VSDILGAATALAALLTLAVIALGRLRMAVLQTVLIALAVAGLVWLVGLGLTATGWQDADGWVDCDRNCDGWHWVGGLLVLTPPLLALALGFAVLVAVLRGRFDDAGPVR
jgi:hypothetical protein